MSARGEVLAAHSRPRTSGAEEAIRRTASAALTGYRHARDGGLSEPDWPELAAKLASAVDLLLGIADDQAGDLRAVWDTLDDLTARTDQNRRHLDAYDQMWSAIGQLDSVGAPRMHGPARPRFTMLPGGAAQDPKWAHH